MTPIARIAVLLALVSSCTGGEPPPPITVPQLPVVDIANLPLPRAEQGRFIMIEVEHARIEIDPNARDPIAAMGTCADLVTYCYRPGERSLDQCIAVIPVCQSGRPWEEMVACCPTACRDTYQRRRTAGTAALAAFEEVYLTQPDCFPGVRDALAGR